MKMLCSPGFQSSINPLMDIYCPVHSLCPEVRPLLWQQGLLERNIKEIKSSLALMEKLQQCISEEMDHVPASVDIQPFSYKLEKEGEGFAMTLNTKDFSPEEICVRQVGRKLRVSGKTEKKQGDGKGSYSYRCQEFRQEIDLPEGLNPETVTCSMTPDGKLHIEAPNTLLSSERVVPINCSLDVRTPQSLSSQTEGTTMDSQKQHQNTGSHVE
ncbi:heat shock protein 30-like [Esox lucius]|nr:heat shock protein 30-like [Esox lucius]